MGRQKRSLRPVQAPTKYVIVLNLKTAKALDLTIPERLAPVLNIVSTAALHHLFWPRVRSGSFSTEKVKAQARPCPLQLR